MKISFNTNGWDEFSWKDFYAMAKDLAFDGIEIHDINRLNQTDITKPFSEENIARTARELAKLEITIPCIDASCDIADKENIDEVCAEIEKYIGYAKVLKCPCIRLRAGAAETATEDTVIECIKRTYKKAEEADITLCIETIGLFTDTSRLRNVLNVFASDNVAALWDFNHTYRYGKESTDKTIQNLGAFVKHVHIKDSEEKDNKVEYCLMGEGTLPIEDMMDALRSINYEGYISFEWIPSWIEELNDAGIVFPHFVNYMSRYKTETEEAGHLYNNRSNTGKYIWEHDKLIDLTFPQLLDRVVEEFPDQYAFRYTTLNYTRTYSEFRDDVDTLARALIALGVKPGGHVAIWATNVPQWYLAFWATTKIGAVLVTVNTAYKLHDAEYLLRHSDTHTLIMIDSALDSDYVAIINELCPELKSHKPGEPLHAKRLPFLRNVINVTSKQPGCLTWEDTLKMADQVPIEEVYRRAAAIDKHDVCNMQYTSGTTGFPKGVMLTHYNVVNNGKLIGDRMDLSTADRMMIQVPMFHCFGMVLSMTASMTHGTTMSPLPYFNAKAALACINQERITCFNGVPTMFTAMFANPDFEKTDFSYMRTGIMAGSSCPVQLMKEAAERMNMREITSVYGQTEASPGCTMSDVNDSLDDRVSTVGTAFPGVECRVVNPETGEEVADGENGEFVARGYNIMKGYYKMPQATATAIDKEGWLHTGDLACRTPEGRYHITGRLKDMIIRGGENVYPKEIEEFILTHDKVQDVQVIGVPDERYGEEIMACIILKEGEHMEAEEMKEYIRSNLARHNLPRYIEFVDDFPMNAAGKILKYKMREDAVKKLNLTKVANIEMA